MTNNEALKHLRDFAERGTLARCTLEEHKKSLAVAIDALQTLDYAREFISVNWMSQPEKEFDSLEKLSLLNELAKLLGAKP